MKITALTIEWTYWTVAKHSTDEGDWVSIYQRPNVDGAAEILIWDGPVHLWLELRVVFNQMHQTLLGEYRPQAFPGHSHVLTDDQV